MMRSLIMLHRLHWLRWHGWLKMFAASLQPASVRLDTCLNRIFSLVITELITNPGAYLHLCQSKNQTNKHAANPRTKVDAQLSA